MKQYLMRLLLSVFIATQAMAEENPTKVQLGKSTITGSALESDVTLIPSNLSIVDSDHITKVSNFRTTDIVKKLSGVRVERDMSFNPRPKIRIRGVNYGTLLMLDNVILTDLEGENRIFNSLALYDIERVEVARGAYSSLYGTGAIGGVINFITSMPDKFQTQAFVGYGNELVKDTADKNVLRFYGNIGDVLMDNKLRVKLSIGYTGTQGYSNFPTILPKSASASLSDLSGSFKDKANNTIIGTGGDRSFQTYDIALKTSYELGANDEIFGSLRFSSYSYDFGNFVSYLKDQQGNSTHLVGGKDYFVGSGYGGMGRYSHLIGNLGYLHSFESSTLKVSLSSVNLFSIWQDALQGTGDRSGGAGWTQDTDSSSNYLDVIYQDEHSENHKLSLGTQFRYYQFVQDMRNITNWRVNSTRTNTYRKLSAEAFVSSLYANVDSLWLDSENFGKFSSSVGLRFDHWMNFNGNFFDGRRPQDNRSNLTNTISVLSPKLALNYLPLDSQSQTLKLSASIGSGFRVATLRDMYRYSSGSSIWLINQNLKHERALNFELGAEYKNEYFSHSLYYYQIEMFDMIYRAGSGTENDKFQNINAGRGRINGIEYAFTLPLFGELSLEGNYTLTNAVILNNPTRPKSVGNQLAETPKHMTNLFLNYFPKFGFYASLWAHYIPAFFNSDLNNKPLSNTFANYETQFTLNTKLGYAMHSGFDFSVQFSNITNNRYYDYYRVGGASFYAQIGYKY